MNKDRGLTFEKIVDIFENLTFHDFEREIERNDDIKKVVCDIEKNNYITDSTDLIMSFCG